MRFGLLLVEVCRALWALPAIEWARRHEGPRRLVEGLRRVSSPKTPRDPAQRDRLRRAIHLVDAACLRRNCLRRALLEVALDAGAAREPLYLGFRREPEGIQGHAWLGSSVPRSHFPLQVQL